MSEFCKKYDLKETQMKALIKDGWITCSLPQYEEIIVHYRSSQSMQKTADAFNVSKKTVYDIVHRYSG
jgi:predicted DNA-binding protein YlxM (UPF0122 family)